MELEHLYKHFHIEGHKGFLNEVSVTFIDKTDGKDPEKENDIGCQLGCNHVTIWS